MHLLRCIIANSVHHFNACDAVLIGTQETSQDCVVDRPRPSSGGGQTLAGLKVEVPAAARALWASPGPLDLRLNGINHLYDLLLLFCLFDHLAQGEPEHIPTAKISRQADQVMTVLARHPAQSLIAF